MRFTLEKRDPSKKLGRLVVFLLAIACSGACLADPFTGSQVTVDLLAGVAPSSSVRLPDGANSHYELWVAFGDEGVVSIGKFVVTGELTVVSYPDVENRIGSVTGAEDGRRSGVRWVSEYRLDRATTAFVTLEPNGETDIAPSRVTIMDGDLAEDGPGTLRGQMEGEYTNFLGETLNPVVRITIIIAEDDVYF